eukprot:48078-Prymnesium_polylepis.1
MLEMRPDVPSVGSESTSSAIGARIGSSSYVEPPVAKGTSERSAAPSWAVTTEMRYSGTPNEGAMPVDTGISSIPKDAAYTSLMHERKREAGSTFAWLSARSHREVVALAGTGGCESSGSASACIVGAGCAAHLLTDCYVRPQVRHVDC